MLAVVKVIETAGTDLGDEYNMQVSGGQHSIRGAIKGNYTEAHTLEQLPQVAGTSQLGKANTNTGWKHSTESLAGDIAVKKSVATSGTCSHSTVEWFVNSMSPS